MQFIRGEAVTPAQYCSISLEACVIDSQRIVAASTIEEPIEDDA